MGRGRAKAKQTKVARRLKYQSLDTDFEALQRELQGGANDSDESSDEFEADDDYDNDDARWR
ncbi:MAG TPA: DUF3073 domain-containing protein [Jiangellaceae bacterium]|jgi:hypothetical protein